MVNVELVETTPQHLTNIWLNMSPDDVQECLDSGVRPRDALRMSVRNSLWTFTILVDGEPAAIWGMGGVFLGEEGRPWMLTTPRVRRAPKTCLQIARVEMRRALVHYPRLVSLVSAAHVKALRTMEAIGFSIGPMQQAGKLGNLFCKIEMVHGN